MEPPPLPSHPVAKANKSKNTLVIVLAVLGGVFLVGSGVFAAILLPTIGKVRETARRTVDASNLRQVVQAALIAAVGNDSTLPTFDSAGGTIQGVAAQLARDGGLNDAAIWFAAGSGVSVDGTVWDRASGHMYPRFGSAPALAWDFATGLTTAMPATTPVAWTRGLQRNGTWSSEGVYGTDGGFIAFLGGNVSFFPDLKSMPLMRPGDGTRTSNILEALPVSARIVGAGPGTLHGSRNLPK